MIKPPLFDARFHDNPLVAGAPHIRFDAGAPLACRDGAVIAVESPLSSEQCTGLNLIRQIRAGRRRAPGRELGQQWPHVLHWSTAMRPIHDTCLVNDIHSALNPTRVARVHQPHSTDELGTVIAQAARDGLPVAVCGGRHAMGGQQFAANAVLIDMRRLRRVLAFDAAAGLIAVEAGIEWPELIDYLETAAMPGGRRWSIRQKQTGADRLSLGGCVAANIHGRGLRMRPFIGDVEAFTLVDADGVPRHCSRTVNRELFALAIGGYGLFGIVASMATDGRHYDSSRLQQATYLDGYHLEIDRTLGHCGSEVIGELYVPRERLADFMRAAAADFRQHGVDLVYGTIRLIERDTESFLPWARQDYACVIFNLHTPHTPGGVAATHATFRRLIDMAIARDGSFYLTYANAATAGQVRACYPDFTRFLAAKRRHDPQQRFQSSWYRHHAALFAGAAQALAA